MNCCRCAVHLAAVPAVMQELHDTRVAMLDAADTISEELAIAEGLLERCNLEELQSNALAERPQDFIAALRHLVRSSRLLACAVAEDMREELAP